MKRLVLIAVVVIAALSGVAYYSGMWRGEPAQAAVQGADRGAFGQGGGRGGRRGGGGGGFGGGTFRPPMTVETAVAHKASIATQITVVGNLIGEATVSVVPRTNGRVQDVYVRLGDRVSKGQRIAKLEDQDIVEQVRQAEAAQEVSLATIRQREADLKRAQTNVERSRNLYERQLLPKQTLDDNEATYQAAVAQLDLARAQNAQSKARLDELRVTLGNTVITSPVNGFVARRAVDPGAAVSPNAPVADVVDITRVRLVVNVVEKDLKELHAGDSAKAEVDAFPGESFVGRIARLAPVLDPSTRTAQLEIEIPNPDYRLKPGMYARVNIVTNTKKDALVVPINAVVDLGGRRGVFMPQADNTAVFHTITPGAEQGELVEVLDGLKEGDRIITTGAAALRDGDRIVLAGGGRAGRRGQGNLARAGQPGQSGPAATDGSSVPNADAGNSQFRRGGDGQQVQRGSGQFGRGGAR
jgi:RND family efflux transporter MFP subunit